MAPRIIVLLGLLFNILSCKTDDDLQIRYNLDGEYANWLKGEFFQDYIAISNLGEIDEHTHVARHTEYEGADEMSEYRNHYESRHHSMYYGIYPVRFGLELTRYKEFTQLSVYAPYQTKEQYPYSSEYLKFNLDNKTYIRDVNDPDTFHVTVAPFDSVYRVLENKSIGGKTYPLLVQITFDEIKTFGAALSSPIIYIEPEWGIVAYELNDGRIWTVQK